MALDLPVEKGGINIGLNRLRGLRPRVRMLILLEEVAVELSKPFREQHIGDRLALLVNNLLYLVLSSVFTR